MKINKTKLYAKALAEVIYKNENQPSPKATAWQGKIVDNFLKLLVKNNQEKKAKEILGLAEDLLLIKQGKRKIIFNTARKMSADQKKLLHDFIKSGDVVKEKIDPELIAGIKIIINDSKQFDASLAGKLQNIF